MQCKDAAGVTGVGKWQWYSAAYGRAVSGAALMGGGIPQSGESRPFVIKASLFLLPLEMRFRGVPLYSSWAWNSGSGYDSQTRRPAAAVGTRSVAVRLL